MKYKTLLILSIAILTFAACSKDDSGTVVFSDNFKTWASPQVGSGFRPTGWDLTGTKSLMLCDPDGGGLLFKGNSKDEFVMISKTLNLEKDQYYSVILELYELPRYLPGLEICVKTGDLSWSEKVVDIKGKTRLQAYGVTTISVKYSPYQYTNLNPKRVKSITVIKD